MDKLLEYRQEIDKIDSEIISLIAKRFEVVKLVWEYKKQANMESLQPSRWAEVLKTKKALAREFGLDEILIENIWNNIHEFAILEEDKQKNINN